MSGIEIKVDASEIARNIVPRFEALAELDRRELLDHLGALGVSQTQRRIAEEKQSPDGVPWKPNRRGGSILELEGNLLTSQHHEVESDEDVSWGSNLVYAGIHQEGGVITPKNKKRLVFRIGNQTIFATKVTIPARPYLGLSGDNKKDIVEALNSWIDGLLQ